MQIRLRAGRVFTSGDARIALPLIRWFPQQPVPPGSDRPQPRPVAVINEAMARQFWPGQDPVGREFRALFSPAIAVIGVVADTRDEALDRAAVPQFFLHDLQEPQPQMTLLVRVSGEPAAVAAPIRSIVAGLDPGLAIRNVATIEELRGRAYGRQQFAARLLVIFGALALALMAVGLYGLIAFTTSQQLPELGVRIALGASRRRIAWMIVTRVLKVTLAGLLAGAGGAAAVGWLLHARFYGVEPADPGTWSLVAAVIVLLGLGACWRLARLASALDPAAILRNR
jgi:hypothetical protein